jgi:hypothetical protein
MNGQWYRPLQWSKLWYVLRESMWGDRSKHPNIPYTIVFIYNKEPILISVIDASLLISLIKPSTTYVPIPLVFKHSISLVKKL